MFSSQEELQELVGKLARGEAVSDRALTDFCRACFLHSFDKVFAAAKAAGVPPEEFGDLADTAVEEMKRHIRVEIVADGEGFRLLTGATH